MSFLDTAEDLDLRALAQQHKEASELLQDMAYDEQEFVAANHPVRRMWTGYEVALGVYVACMGVELTRRGIIRGLDSLQLSKPIEELRRDYGQEFDLPPWFSDQDIMRSHRSNLIRRYPADYSKHWKGTPANLPYLWPVVDEEGGYKIMLSKRDKELIAEGERDLPATIKKKVSNL
jgi:hypothetical protein